MVKVEPTTVTMDMGLYEAYKAAWEAVNNNLDIKIEKGFFYVGYIIKTESEVIDNLKSEIRQLQKQATELEMKMIKTNIISQAKKEVKKRKWFNL